KFVGIGEKLDGLETFHPDRMANRILGMGDIVSLVEDAQRNVDQAAAQELAAKLKSGNRFDLNDFLAQLGQMSKMGGLGSMLDKRPAQFQQAARSEERRVGKGGRARRWAWDHRGSERRRTRGRRPRR